MLKVHGLEMRNYSRIVRDTNHADFALELCGQRDELSEKFYPCLAAKKLLEFVNAQIMRPGSDVSRL